MSIIGHHLAAAAAHGKGFANPEDIFGAALTHWYEPGTWDASGSPLGITTWYNKGVSGGSGDLVGDVKNFISSINGLPAAELTQSHVFDCTTAFSVKNIYVAAVVQMVSGSASYLFSFANGGPEWGWSSSRLYSYYNGLGQTNVTHGEDPLAAPMILECMVSGEDGNYTGRMWLDGDLKDTKSFTAALSPSVFRIGQRLAGTSPTDDTDIGDIVIVRDPYEVTDAQRTLLRGWMRNKYGL